MANVSPNLSANNVKLNIKKPVVSARPLKVNIINTGLLDLNNTLPMSAKNAIPSSFDDFVTLIPQVTKAIYTIFVGSIFKDFVNDYNVNETNTNASNSYFADSVAKDAIFDRYNFETFRQNQFPQKSNSPKEEVEENTNDLKLSYGQNYSSDQMVDENGYYAIPEGKTSAKGYEAYQGVTAYANGAICQGTTYNGVTYDTRTEEDTGLRYTMIDGEKYYCIAMGNAYGNIGDLFEITTDTGQTFKAIKGDAKSEENSNSCNILLDGKLTSAAHTFGSDNSCVVEMICDGNPYQSEVRNMGSYDVLEQFSGNIESIRIIGSTQ